MLEDREEKSSFGPKHNWKCPREGCRKEITAWTEGGLRALKEPHVKEHESQDRENMILFQRAILEGPPRDYNKWELTVADKAFLRTRGVSDA
jgi:hypothetical protein